MKTCVCRLVKFPDFTGISRVKISVWEHSNQIHTNKVPQINNGNTVIITCHATHQYSYIEYVYLICIFVYPKSPRAKYV